MTVYNNVGSVELFYDLGYAWGRVQTLRPSIFLENLRYGSVCVIDDDYIIVGSAKSKKAYVYIFNTYVHAWIERHVFQENIPNFGILVGQSKNFIVIGSDNALFIYLTSNYIKTHIINDQIKVVSITDDYLVYTNINGITFVLKWMFDSKWNLVDFFDNTKTSVIRDNTIVIVRNFNEVIIKTNISYTNSPSQNPTKTPTSQPTVFVAPTVKHMSSNLVYGGIVFPIFILLTGLGFLYYYTKNKIAHIVKMTIKYDQRKYFDENYF